MSPAPGAPLFLGGLICLGLIVLVAIVFVIIYAIGNRGAKDGPPPGSEK